MTIITMTELKNDLKKYTEMAEKEDVLITKNGKPYVKMVSIEDSKRKSLEAIRGILPSNFDVNKALWEEKYSKI